MAKTYDQNQVLVTVAGVRITGFSGGITIGYEGEDWSHKNDADGEVIRSRLHNDVGMITFALQKGVDANGYISGLAKTDRQSGLGQVHIYVKDLLGEDLGSIREATIVKLGDLNFDVEAQPIEWQFKGKLEMDHGSQV